MTKLFIATFVLFVGLLGCKPEYKGQEGILYCVGTPISEGVKVHRSKETNWIWIDNKGIVVHVSANNCTFIIDRD